MTSRWHWVLRLVTRRIWFRAALFSLFSILLALLAAAIASVIPGDISTKIGSKAVDNILEILASSMLAVTTVPPAVSETSLRSLSGERRV
jgi:uncharacterized membrane protein